MKSKSSQGKRAQASVSSEVSFFDYGYILKRDLVCVCVCLLMWSVATWFACFGLLALLAVLVYAG
ncbi:unnamed protein product, partial [Linum tenue]